MTESYGTSDLYLLASRINKQPVHFVSWLPKLSAWAAKPFFFVWKRRNFYIFLLFCCGESSGKNYWIKSKDDIDCTDWLP